MTKTEKLLREIIALPSVNPAFPADAALTGERFVADFLGVTAARAGLEVEFQEVLPDRANVLARLLPPGKPRQTIILAPHMDTVPAAHDGQYTPRKQGDRLYGRGACDTKGSVAAMLMAVCDVARAKDRPRETEIIFAGLIDEENGQSGSRALAKRVKADLAIVGEPTSLRIVTAHKGNLWLQLETRGRSAHGARPELGHNAVHDMARIVDALETDYAAELRRRRRHPLLGPATVNVGTIHGGTQPNIVPDRCVITLDRRTLPGETEAGTKREIAAFLAKRKLRATFSSARRLSPCHPMETNPKLPLIRSFMRSVGQRAPVGIHFFCDAAVLAEGGIPSVVFGPGDIAQGHTSDEWISVRSLERARELLVGFLKSLP